VEEREDGVRIAPVDWEMAAIGPGLVDVAALTAGWGPEQRRELVDAYRDEIGGDTETGMEEALACSRLHLAMQWLGWSPGWSPPPEHRRDWLGEALRAAEELQL
jgi:thiamine kinase-like enzyme